MIKLKVIMEWQGDRFEKRINDFFSIEKNIVRTFYSTCMDDQEMYFTAFIEYRDTNE